MAANIWRPAGVNNNYNNSLNWSLLAVPTASDGNVATFDANILSGPCTVNVASVCNSVDFSAYNNTITMTNTLTSSGNVILGSGMTISGASQLIVNASSTLTANGKLWPNGITINGATSTYTLADIWTVGGTFTFGAAGVVNTLNGSSLRCNANFTQVGTGQSGTTNIFLQGTGNWTVNAGTLYNPITFNGTYTFVGATLTYSTGILTYSAGTIGGTVPALVIGGSCTLNTSGMNWNNITQSTAGAIVTLTSALNSIGTTAIAANTIFSGTAGVNASTFNCTTAGVSTTFRSGLTYSVSTAMTLRGTAASNIVFISSTTGTQYNLVLSAGATQDVSFTNATDANSNLGLTIYDYKGAINNTANWFTASTVSYPNMNFTF